MPFSNDTYARGAFKRLNALSHTSNDRDPANESIRSGPVIDAALATIAETIDNSQSQAVTDGTIEVVTFDLTEVSGSNGKAYEAKFPSGYSGYFGVGAAGNLLRDYSFAIPKTFSSPVLDVDSDGYNPILRNSGSTKIAETDPCDWYWDETAGVAVCEDTGAGGTNWPPATIKVCIFIGQTIQDILDSAIQDADEVSVDTTNFDNNLSAADDTVQKALETIDEFNLSGSGDVVGPGSATDNAVARFDSTTGKLIQNSTVTIDDSGNIATSGTVDGRDVSTDGTKLDGIESGATADQNAVDVPVTTTSFDGILSAADTNVQLALDTIDDHVHPNATVSVAGFMSATDKTKLDGIEAGATADQTAVEVPFTPAGGISATDVQNALEELDTEKGSGDVVGPGSSTDEAVARFDSTTGKLIQNSTVTIDDSGNIATSGTVDGRDVSTDGTKLDGIESGATADQNAVDVPVTTTSFDGILSAADTNVQLALDTIDDHVHPNATVSVAGFMSAADKTKLDGIESGATADQDAVDVPTNTAGFNNNLSAADTNVQLALDTIDNLSIAPTTPTYLTQSAEAGLPNHFRLNTVSPITDVVGTNVLHVGIDIGLVSEKTTPGNDDFLLIREDGTGDNKKVKISNLPGGGGSGDVVGPGSSTDEAITRFDGTTGKLVQNSSVTIDDSGNISTSGTVDGRDVSADGTKLDGIESGATADQSAAEVPVTTTSFDGILSAADTNVQLALDTIDDHVHPNATVSVAGFMSASDKTKLDGIESGATADQNAIDVPTNVSGFNNNLSSADTDVQKALDTIDNLSIGSGDVVGPGSSTDEAVARFDSTTGKLLQNSSVTIDDSGNISTSGTVDGRDVSTDGTKLDGIESGATADQSAAEVPFTPYGDIASTNVQDAIEELDDEKAKDTLKYITNGTESSLPNHYAFVVTNPIIYDDTSFPNVYGIGIDISTLSEDTTPLGTASIIIEQAGGAHKRTKFQYLRPALRESWSTLTYSSSITPDASANSRFEVTLTGDTTINIPTNLSEGQVIVYRIRQDATGGRSVTWHSNYRTGQIPNIEVADGASKTTYVICIYHEDDTKMDMVSFMKDY
jgi:hypothetical protein